MSEMIERVARRLCAAGGADPDASAGWLLQPERKLWQDHVSEARAAIEAMREPTEDVAEIMSAHASNGMVDWRDLHEAMIDAALETVPA